MTTVKVVILWHMHQPCYRDPLDGRTVLPWVRLHALKDYLGMVELLGETPRVHATFNLTPVLVDQLEAYAQGLAREPLQELTVKAAAELRPDEALALLRGLFQAHPGNLIGRHARFAELHARREAAADEGALRAVLSAFTTEDLLDLQVVSKLAWCDRDWQRRDPVLKALVDKERGYGEEDKRVLAEREQALLRAVLPAYRRAAQRGQVELSTSPYYHPILPLLCDVASHHEARPGAPLPASYRHPEDAADQIRRALDRHESAFGSRPAGLWPPEAALSEAAVAEMARAGVRWTASDEGVLERSVNRALHRDSAGTAYPMELLYRPWRRRSEHGQVTLLFRDRALSDLIAFSYGGVDPEQAASDLLERLRRVGRQWHTRGLEGQPVVGIMLDGENAWEHFADGGRVFLRHLYAGLQADESLAPSTVAEALEKAPATELPRVFAGSWIGADLSIWVGHADDRRAWSLLADARQALERSPGHVAPEALARAWEAFRSACGSDWFWWYGGEHPTENAFEFDQLFRRSLQAVYRELGLLPPERLGESHVLPGVARTSHSRPTGRLQPVLDGELTTPDEWLGAGVYRAAAGVPPPAVAAVHFGPSGERLAVLIETTGPALRFLERYQAGLVFPGPTTVRFRVVPAGGSCRLVREERAGMGWWVKLPTRAHSAAGRVIEASIPLGELRPAPGQQLDFKIVVLEGQTEAEQHPQGAPLSVALEGISRA